MSYGSSYQGGYQKQGISNTRRRDYDDLGGSAGGGGGFSTNAYNSRPQQQQQSASSSRMQTMEVLSGREYGNEFESGGGSVAKSRFTIYAGVAFLLFIVLVAPHRDESDSNFKLPKQSNATGATSAGTEKDKMSAPLSEESSMESSAQSPLEEPETAIRSSPSRPQFATICDLPPSVQRDSHNFTILNRTNFCLSEPISGEKCTCLNPTIPAIPSYSHEVLEKGKVGWNGTTQMNIQLINQSLAALVSHDNNEKKETEEGLDVVLLGDSITEHWNGRDMGVSREKDYNVSLVFQTLFQKKNGSSLEGLALGVAGDRCQNVLWRLQHGEMPPSLNPKVWWLLIGTNDLGVDSCSGDAIVIGNIRIVEEIRRHYPKTPIVINSMLPRSREELLHHNELWKISSQVNHRLACYATSQSGVFFFNATSLFIYEDLQNEEEYGVEMYINETLMLDHLHPSGEGALLWGKEIVKEVLNITKI